MALSSGVAKRLPIYTKAKVNHMLQKSRTLHSSGSSSTWLPLRNSPPSRLPWSGPVSSFRSSLAATSTSPSDECPFVKLPGQWMCIKTAGVLAGTVTGSPATLCFTCLFTPAQQSSIARWLEPSPSLYIYISVYIHVIFLYMYVNMYIDTFTHTYECIDPFKAIGALLIVTYPTF